jgi:superoxide reductase
MTKLRQLYRCNVCGNVVEITNEGAPDLHCCGEPMSELDAKTEDTGSEKHVPVVEEVSGGVLVKIGSVAHPMEDKHYIKFIEVLTSSKVLRAELKPGDKPEAEFCVKKSDITGVREFCTVHMLWKA